MSPGRKPKRPAARRTAGGKATVFTAEEREAMKEHAREQKDRARRGGGGAADAAAVQAKIAAMPEPDRAMAARLHAVITACAPGLAPRLWYGMPAYARDGKVVCFFQGARKFKTRYATLGFSDRATLDDGALWPTSFAITALGPAEVARIEALVRRATG